MEAVLLICTLAAFAIAVTGAPTYTTPEDEQLARAYEEHQHYREARSQYPPQYVLPCGAAAGGPGRGYGSPYHLNVPGYGVPHYGYGLPHYRSVDEQMEPEMLAFSDMDQFQQRQMMMDHIPMARSGFGAPLSPIGPGLALNGPVLTSPAGPAYGIFPNANVGRCNVPLLFSCSPSISSGHIVESQPHYAPIAALPAPNSYRLSEQAHHEVYEHSEDDHSQHSEPVHEPSHEPQAHT